MKHCLFNQRNPTLPVIIQLKNHNADTRYKLHRTGKKDKWRTAGGSFVGRQSCHVRHRWRSQLQQLHNSVWQTDSKQSGKVNTWIPRKVHNALPRTDVNRGKRPRLTSLEHKHNTVAHCRLSDKSKLTSQLFHLSIYNQYLITANNIIIIVSASSCTPRVRKPNSLFLSITLLVLTNFQNSFTLGLSSKCVMKQLLNMPPHLKHITTLPCEK